MQNTTHTHCLRCGRPLTSAKSQAAGYGPTCARHIRRAQVELTDYKAHQVASAIDLIEDGAIVLIRDQVFAAVSTDGTETHLVHPAACNCKAGLRGTRCYHQLAARMLLAA
ncbi:DUF6011 domain-containing protein [Streptomyces sp. NPDC051133]|uniref:DUF6011 domain-containing protein n=1 Tax=Streptomyces sp. NPDC051133 TaxID=3155521 RepID=UPI003434E490